jgi:hypothetical protein
MTGYRMSSGAATEAQFPNARRTMLSVSPAKHLGISANQWADGPIEVTVESASTSDEYFSGPQ